MPCNCNMFVRIFVFVDEKQVLNIQVNINLLRLIVFLQFPQKDK